MRANAGADCNQIVLLELLRLFSLLHRMQYAAAVINTPSLSYKPGSMLCRKLRAPGVPSASCKGL
jgi:hypothetical protein